MATEKHYYLYVNTDGDITYARRWNAPLQSSNPTERIHVLNRERQVQEYDGADFTRRVDYSRVGVIIRVIDPRAREVEKTECLPWLRWNRLSWTLWSYLTQQNCD